ncbi:MAG: hypothetical protein ACXVEF_35905 [Polyangiales bacterium]
MHPLLSAAATAMHERFVWREVPHLGGPIPVVTRRAQAEVVAWCAEMIAPLIDAPRLPHYREVLSRVERYRNEPTQELLEHARAALHAIARPIPEEDPAIMARFALLAAQHIVRDLRNASRVARIAVRRTVLFSVATPRPELPRPAAFLRALDDRLLRAELEAGIRRRVKEPPPILRIIHRAADERGRPTVWLAEIEGGWGSLVRRHGFHWTTGSLDEVVAVVPDEHFEAAANAAYVHS